MKAIIYTRVSTKSQNIYRQLKELENKCSDKSWTVYKKVSDTISGAKPYTDRKGFIEIIEQAKKKAFEVIVVHEISRLGRNTVDVLKCIQELNSYGISVYILNIDTEIKPDRVDPSANLIVAVLASLATHERELIRQRILSGLKASNKNSGRRAGEKYGIEEYRKKYPVVVRLLNDGYNMKTVSNLTGTSYRTVQRIKRILNDHSPI
ncbi:MAG: recombinase family protein [Flavobacteriales bacterium]|nr:recombinase family protein [Flavobacteriales bacterium]